MRTTQIFAAFLATLGLSACVSITAIDPDPNVSSRVSPEEAHEILRHAGGTLCGIGFGCGAFQPTVARIEVTDDQLLVFVETNGNRSHTLPVQSLKPRLEMVHENGWVHFDDTLTLSAIPGALARNVFDALLVLKSAPGLQEQHAAFESQAKAYREAAMKPVLSEDVRRYAVQAEAAVTEKRFDDAAGLYLRALQVAPWWPEGQFNAAMILADLHRYLPAIEHMKNYLALAPDAPDARAAQDKIYVWQGEQSGQARDVQAGTLVGPSTTNSPPEKRHFK